MTIKVTYNVTDVYMSQSVSPVYINVSYSDGGTSGGGVWGSITGTLSNQTDLQTALDLKVPYSGATGNVNLGEYELKAGQVTLDTSPTGTAAVGTIRWNDTTGTSETTLKGGNVIIKNGVDLVARVVNKVSPNTTLTKAAYQAVRVSGAQGQRLAIELAQANNDAGSADTIGLVTETIAPNQEGFIMTVGQLEGINTTGSLQGETWVDGDVLYLSPTTAGAITNVKPTGATGHLVIIGYVEYAHVNNGKIYVKVMNGWELDELHNVSIVTPTDNQGLFYNSTSTLWENKSITTALGYTPVPTTRNITINGVTYDLSADRTWTISTGISGSGASGQVTYWTGASAVSGSNNLFWDNANGRLGIGTNTPLGTLNIRTTTTTSTAPPMYFSGTSNSTGLNLDYGVITLENRSTTAGTYSALLFTGGTNQYGFAGVFGVLGANTSALNWNGDLVFGTRNSNTFDQRLRLYSNGNLVLQNGGTFSDGGQRLQVIGDTLLRGSGATSATTALTVQNSDSNPIFYVENNGGTYVRGRGANNVFFVQSSAGANLLYVQNVGVIGFTAYTWVPESSTASVIFDASISRAWTIAGNAKTATSGVSAPFLVTTGYAPTSGTGVYNALTINPTINQTGGANGITRGLYVNPTLTSAADFRAIETTAGNVLIGTNANQAAGVFITNSSTGNNQRSILRVINNAGENGTFSVWGSATGLPNKTLFESSKDFIIGTDSNTATGGTSKFQIYVGGYNAVTSPQLSFHATANLSIGSTADNGQRLQVYGDSLLRGSGATSATTALTVQNSSSTNLFTVRNDGNVGIGTASPTYKVHSYATSGGAASGFMAQNIGIGANDFASYSLQNSTLFSQVFLTSNNYTLVPMIGANSFGFYSEGSGGMTFWSNNASGTIKFGVGTATGAGSQKVTIKAGGQVRFHPLASAPASPEAGDVYYDSTLNKLRVYTTAWETITSV